MRSYLSEIVFSGKGGQDKSSDAIAISDQCLSACLHIVFLGDSPGAIFIKLALWWCYNKVLIFFRNIALFRSAVHGFRR